MSPFFVNTGGQKWDVLSLGGQYRLTVAFPTRLRLLDARGDTVLTAQIRRSGQVRVSIWTLPISDLGIPSGE